MASKLVTPPDELRTRLRSFRARHGQISTIKRLGLAVTTVEQLHSGARVRPATVDKLKTALDREEAADKQPAYVCCDDPYCPDS